VFATGGWMLFDGTRALVVGDFVTPKQGAYAGQLGPWSHLVSAVGLDPRSAAVKLVFVCYGLAYLLALAAFLLHLSGAWLAVLVLAIAGLWYLPIGTLTNLAVIAILVLVPSVRAAQ
jgi:hypothetical protein